MMDICITEACNNNSTQTIDGSHAINRKAVPSDLDLRCAYIDSKAKLYVFDFNEIRHISGILSANCKSTLCMCVDR